MADTSNNDTLRSARRRKLTREEYRAQLEKKFLKEHTRPTSHVQDFLLVLAGVLVLMIGLLLWIGVNVRLEGCEWYSKFIR